MARLRALLSPLVVSLPALAASPAQAPAAKADAPLSEAIPAGVHFFTTWKATPERDALEAPYLQAMRRFWDSGVVWDVVDLATLDEPRERRDGIRETVDKVFTALGKVEWDALFGREGAFAFRFGVPFPEYLLVGRAAGPDPSRHLASLRSCLAELAALAPEHLQIKEGPPGEAESSSLVLKEAPFGIHVGRAGRAVVVAIGQPLFASTLHLLRTAGGEGSVAKAPDVAKALSLLPADRDEEGVFDVGGAVEYASGVVSMGAAGAGDRAAPILSAIGTLFDEASVLRSVAWTGKAAAGRLTYEEAVLFEPGSSDRFLRKLLGTGRPAGEAARFVPKEAVACSVDAGCDLLGAYDALLRAVGAAEGGAGLLERWEGLQARIGFHLRRDLLSWIGSESVTVCLPSARGGLFGDVEGVLLQKVTNPGEASSRIANLLERAAAFLGSRGQSMRNVPITGAPGLFEVGIEAFPGFRPVVGVRDGWLVLACSAEAVAKVWAAREGKAPGILENERFRGLGLAIDGKTSAFTYADVEGELEGLAQLLSAAGFGLSMLPRAKDTEPALKIGAILTKLGRFFRDVDLGRDRGSVCAPLEGAEGLRIRTAETFRSRP